ncbi:MAG: STAS domain-containing protein [Dehalococcoidia bacterium]
MNVKKVSDEACIIQMPAELIDQDEQPAVTACAPQKTGQMRNVILDFGPITKMNGLGASMLVKLDALTRYRGQLLYACRLSDAHHKVMAVTGLHQRFQIYEKIEDALIACGIPADKIELPALALQLEPLDNDTWAKPVTRLKTPEFPPEAWNRNINGRLPVGPVNGFGQLWQKVYQLKISDPAIGPEQAIEEMKEDFPSLQPSNNRFYPSPAGIQPGEIVAIDSSTPGGPVSTGVLVLYADDLSFTFITPQGHPESGWVTFSASRNGENTIVQILGLARANDPVYEAAFRAIGSKIQVKIWTHVLTSLAARLGVPAAITVEPTIVDRKVQWSEAKNTWYNAQIRTLLYAPFRLLGWPRRRRIQRGAYAG